jgi:PEP-CTERM motif
MNRLASLASACAIILASMSPARAVPIYTTADFSGGISNVMNLGNSLGLQRTNTCSGCEAGSVSGHVLFDASLVPGSGTGFVNIPLASAGGVPGNVVFDIMFGSNPLEFKFGDPGISGGPAIQFNNGAFNGFFLVENFLYNENPFQLSIQGGAWTIKGWKTNSYADLAASGYLNTGNNGLTNKALLGPSGAPSEVNAVPEPTTIALIVLGVWGLIMARRREKERAELDAIRAKEDIKWPCPQPLYETEPSDKRELNAG